MDEKTAAIIPVHNEADVIGMCLKSVVDRFDEVIVFDDASTDATPTIVGYLATKHGNIRSLRSSDQVGWGEARNRAGDATNARYLFWMDSDEVLSPHSDETIATTIHSGLPCVRMGHTEMVGDLYHTTFRIHHNDSNQIYTDRKLLPKMRWGITKNGFSTRVTDEPLHQYRPLGHFSFHLKGVKSDAKLAERLVMRLWHVAQKTKDFSPVRKWIMEHGGIFPGTNVTSAGIIETLPIDLVHFMANKYVNGMVELAIPTYSTKLECNRDHKCLQRDSFPILPKEILVSQPGRFQVIYKDGKPIDRIDHVENGKWEGY